MTDPGNVLSERQTRWLTAFLVLGSTAFALVIVSYLTSYWNFFADVIFTFFLAWLLAFVLSSPVRWLMRLVPHLPRIVAIVVVYTLLTIALIVLVVILAQALFSSVNQFIANVPSLRDQLPDILQRWQNTLKGLGLSQVNLLQTANDFLNSLASTAQDLVGPLQQAAVGSIGAIGNVLIVFFLSLFIVIDSESATNFLLRLVPPRYAEDARLLQHSIARSFGGFLRGQAVIGLLYAAVALVVSLLLNLDYAPVTTAASGILMAIPFFGPFVSWIPPVLVAIVTRPDAIVPAVIGMGIGWFVVLNLVQPRLMAEAVGIPPIVVFASILIGSKVAGIGGAIFGLPVAAVISSVVMFYLRPIQGEGPVAVRAARRLGQREGRPIRVPREPDPASDASPEDVPLRPREPGPTAPPVG